MVVAYIIPRKDQSLKTGQKMHYFMENRTLIRLATPEEINSCHSNVIFAYKVERNLSKIMLELLHDRWIVDVDGINFSTLRAVKYISDYGLYFKSLFVPIEANTPILIRLSGKNVL